MFSSMESHGAICFQAWNRMESYGSMIYVFDIEKTTRCNFLA